MKLSELTENDNIVCRSEQEWERIAKLLHESGRKWLSGDNYWPLLYDWEGIIMIYCLDGTYGYTDEPDFAGLVIESTEVEGTDQEAKVPQSFEIGDKCWSPSFGHGEVVEVGSLIKVKFGGVLGNGVHWLYQPDGRESEDSPKPTLFHQEVKEWPCPKRLPPLPDLTVDDKVYVGDSLTPQHFSHWVVDNRIYMAVFADGRTSHTALGGTHLHTRWKIAD